jgi:citrate synthase
MTSETSPETLYLDAQEAAQTLGVSVPTLYAYVSRKMVRSERIDGSRVRKYWKVDIDRLAGKGSAAVTKSPQIPLVSESAITLITEAGLYYRGKDVIELSASMSVESLAAFMWRADEKALFDGSPVAAPFQWAQLQPTLGELSPLDRSIILFPLLERSDPRSYDLSAPGFARTGADVLRWYTSLLVNKKAPANNKPIHQFVAHALKAPVGFDEVIRKLIVLSADHEFDPITYAVRSVANVGVTPYQIASVGLIASQGQRFQAERLGTTRNFLREILDSKDGHSAVVQRLRNGEALPGFQAVAGQVDPRTFVMMSILSKVLKNDPEFECLLKAQQMVQKVSNTGMEFIIPALFVGVRLGLRNDELGISAIGRMIGWIAHAMEQFHENSLIRPRASYTGPLPQSSISTN